jgi:HEAT repeat protein
LVIRRRASRGLVLAEHLRAQPGRILSGGVRGKPHGVQDLLIAQIRVEKDEEVVRHLLSAISGCKSAEAIEVVASYLQHESEDIRAVAIDELVKLGEDALTHVVPLLKDPSPNVGGKVILALKNHPFVSIYRPIEELANHEDPRFRMTALFVIIEVEESRFKSILDRLSCDSNSHVAEIAQEAAKIMMRED